MANNRCKNVLKLNILKAVFMRIEKEPIRTAACSFTGKTVGQDWFSSTNLELGTSSYFGRYDPVREYSF
jgi:hypothetical protein